MSAESSRTKGSPQITVISGATGGIGSAVANLLRSHDLVLLGRDVTRLNELREVHPGAVIRSVDIADEKSISSALGDLTRIDNLIHCTGAVSRSRLSEAKPEDWRMMMEASLFGPMLLTSAAIPLLRARRGTVVFVNSGSALRVRPGWSGYAAAKHAVRALAEGLRIEEPQIRVMSLLVGPVDTRMREDLGETRGSDYQAADYLHPSEVARCIAFAIDMREGVVIPEMSLRPRDI